MRRGAHIPVRDLGLLRDVPDVQREDEKVGCCRTCKHGRQFKQSGFYRCALLPAWSLRVICAFAPSRHEPASD